MRDSNRNRRWLRIVVGLAAVAASVAVGASAVSPGHERAGTTSNVAGGGFCLNCHR